MTAFDFWLLRICLIAAFLFAIGGAIFALLSMYDLLTTE